MNRILRLLLTLGVVSLLGTLNAAAQTTAQINGTVVDESRAARVATLLPDLLDAAECPERLKTRRVGGQAT